MSLRAGYPLLVDGTRCMTYKKSQQVLSKQCMVPNPFSHSLRRIEPLLLKVFKPSNAAVFTIRGAGRKRNVATVGLLKHSSVLAYSLTSSKSHLWEKGAILCHRHETERDYHAPKYSKKSAACRMKNLKSGRTVNQSNDSLILLRMCSKLVWSLGLILWYSRAARAEIMISKGAGDNPFRDVVLSGHVASSRLWAAWW